MVTRGDVSLDVEDNLKPDDWPRISDISTDLIRYSVHLPLDPKVCPILLSVFFFVVHSILLHQLRCKIKCSDNEPTIFVCFSKKVVGRAGIQRVK